VSEFFRDAAALTKPSRRRGFPVCRIFPAVFLAALFTACGHKEAGPPPHYAFLAFENLSGDPSLDWLGCGASEYLARSLRGTLGGGAGDVLTPDAVQRTSLTLGARVAGAPGESEGRAAALVAGANRIVAGYVEHTASGVRVTASEEDASTHKTVRTLSATSTSPFDALKLLAHEFSPQAGPPATANPEAFRLYCTAVQGAVPDAPPLLERAVALDPGFGRAWVSLARTFQARGDRSGASNAIARARAQKIAPLDGAWLDFEDAALGADRSTRLAAMEKVAEFDVGDADLTRSLAAAEINAGNFSRAATAWKKLTVNAPGDVNAWNQLGYTLSWSGDYPGALAAVREYAGLRPNDANPLDSEGDVQYWFGKFSEAAANYSAASVKAPAFLNGGEMYKAAWARFFSRDKAGADAAFEKFRQAREKANDPSIDLFVGDWLYRTGRGPQARALLTTKKAARPPAVSAAIAAQLALWDLLAGDRAAALKDLADSGTTSLTPNDVLLRFAAMPTASAAEWESRAAHLLAAPQLAGIRLTAQGYALILDGKKQTAIPIWEEIVKQASGDDFFPRNILSRLKNEPVEHTTPPDPVNLNQFIAVLDKLQAAK